MEKIIFKGQIIASRDGGEIYYLDETDHISWYLEYDSVVKIFAGKKVEVIVREVEETTNVEND